MPDLSEAYSERGRHPERKKESSMSDQDKNTVRETVETLLMKGEIESVQLEREIEDDVPTGKITMTIEVVTAQ